MLRVYLICLLLSTCSYLHAQTLTSKDFKICIEGIGNEDTLVTAKQLCEAKKIYCNFEWLTIKNVNFSFGGGSINGHVILSFCDSDIICDEVKDNLRRFKEIPLVIITVEAYNKQGYRIQVPDRILMLKQ